MKKLSLLPIVLFFMLIAAMVNPFGCREKANNNSIKVKSIPYKIIYFAGDTGHVYKVKDINYLMHLFDNTNASKISIGDSINGIITKDTLKIYFTKIKN